MQPPREETFCFHNYHRFQNQCYRISEDVAFGEALSQCWSGWQMNHLLINGPSIQNGWMPSAMRLVADTVLNRTGLLVWLPVQRSNLQRDFQPPPWQWTDGEC